MDIFGAKSFLTFQHVDSKLTAQQRFILDRLRQNDAAESGGRKAKFNKICSF